MNDLDHETDRRGFDPNTMMYTLGKIDGKVDTILATQGDLIHRVKHLEESRAEHNQLQVVREKVEVLDGKLGRITLIVVAMSAGSGGLSAALLQFFMGVMG